MDWFCGEDNKLVEQLRGRMQGPLRHDLELAEATTAMLEAAGVPEAKRKALCDEGPDPQVHGATASFFTDGKAAAEKRAVIDKQFNELMQDATIRKILSDQ